MRHRTFLLAPIGALVAALLASPAAAARDSDSTGIDRWPAVSESTLSHMRGGLDAGALVAAFAIERLVRIDGEIVSGTRGRLKTVRIRNRAASEVRARIPA